MGEFKKNFITARGKRLEHQKENNNPEDLILEKIHGLINNGTFTPGMKIPSERVLAEMFNTTRGYIRKALQRLELYGIMEIRPQKGIYVTDLGEKSLDVLISNILTDKKYNIADLIETRAHLEFLSAGLAARRGDDKDFDIIKNAHLKYMSAFAKGESTLEEDHLFHLAIVKASKNMVLQSIISMITPDIIAMNKNYFENGDGEYVKNTYEHEAILKSILARDEKMAGESMMQHMNNSKKRRLKE